MVTQCPNCQAKFKARDDWKGKVTKCPKCKQPFTVAGRQPAATPSATVNTAAAAATERRPTPVAVQSRPASIAAQPRPVPAPRPAVANVGETEHGERLSDTVYVYSVMCALVIGVFSMFLGQFCMRGRDPDFMLFGRILIVIGAALGAYSAVVRLIMYYKMWAAIQDDETRISAGKAVGLLFVPFLNIFWAVYMFVRFPEDYNNYAVRHSVNGERLSKGLFLQYAIALVFLYAGFIVLCILPQFGIGDRLFGRIYATFGRGEGLVYGLVVAWKLLNIPITIWLFAIYAILSSRICRAINAI